MRARKSLTSILVGLAVAVASVAIAAPASAGKPAPAPVAPSYSYTCASLEGVKVTAAYVQYYGVSMKAGESLKVTVSPVQSSDIIYFNYSFPGLVFVVPNEYPASGGVTFTAPSTDVYTLQWSVVTTRTDKNVTWSFDCSSTTVNVAVAPADDDKDGVANTSDVCSGTVLPDAISRPKSGSYFANGSGVFVDGTGRSAGLTVVDTGGCSGIQIAKKLGLSKTEQRSGVTLTQLQAWAARY